MSIFKDVTLAWKGQEYTVKSNEVMKLIAKVEDVITMGELTQATGHKLTRISEAYAVALCHAGCSVSIEEVYQSLFGQGGADAASNAIAGLLMLMVPPDTYNPEAGGGKPPAAKAES